MAASNRYEDLRRELNADTFLQQARDRSGLSDYGDERFVTPLRKMLDCVAHDANFHAAGLKEFKEEVVRDLVNRLRFEADLKRHPEILDEDVSDPIIVLGLSRSGTTKMQRMLAVDTGLLAIYMWQLINPAPFPNAAPGQPDPRIAAARGTDHIAEGHAEVHAGHHMAADQVEEDWQLFEPTFNDWYLNARTPSRSWHDFVMSRREPSDLDNYRYVRSLFQYLQWQQGGRRGRRWLMKHTGHHARMDELLAVFPNAALTHSHRHPAACVPSMAKLVYEIWQLRVADVDPKLAGELAFELGKTSVSRYLEARDRLGLDERIFDVQYDQIRNDPMPVYREIYRRAGLEMTAKTEQAMLQWEKNNEQGKHGRHEYSLEQFGLNEKMIDDAFGKYIKRFIEK